MKCTDFEAELIHMLEVRSRGGLLATGDWISVNNRSHVRILKLQKRDARLMPLIYVKEYHERYEEGSSLEALADEILGFVHSAEKVEGIPEDFFKDFEDVKAGIRFRVVNADKNRALLSDIPHELYEDLAIVFYYELDAAWMEDATILIRNEHLKLWNRTATEVKGVAWKNTLQKKKPIFRKLSTVLREYGVTDVDELQDNPLHLLTNEEGCFGAGVAFYPNVLSECARELDSDLILLPSSIHEWLILPNEGGRGMAQAEDLRTMVREINRTQLAEKEVLSDEIYYYDSELRRMSKI